ncbi:serine/threonine-protein kinase [Spartinivicinus poritis]|uniref:Serine/threonine-protein kinase n=1 Tax=Spartinivicinus poritis TaxID=2994640 RepID=A0ABT5UIF2_9GAMM|nr:serine/threonine-protein kinase [Spartinivicinus sp. A2-2]MDE1465990.1 serine/threonine-protein kinase [Spartinivicinus sp. A2-2]
MFKVDDIIDHSYRVTGECSNSGGMGTILFVEPTNSPSPFPLVLKYCKDIDDEVIQRFRREVKFLASFHGNTKVVQIYSHNLQHEPPYFVMKYYSDGDLTKLTQKIKSSPEAQESLILKMIDCLQELHIRNQYHRDIKPQNFLVEGNHVVVSDFGLSTEIGSNTFCTRSSIYWGTHGYIPPEFLHDGGFKNPDASGDIFMLGKTIYFLLTGRDPLYLVESEIPAPLYYIIDKCCKVDKNQRYQNLNDLKQSLTTAFDVLLQRAEGLSKSKLLLDQISDELKDQKYSPTKVKEFIDQLALLENQEQNNICFELSSGFFNIICLDKVVSHLQTFLDIYEKHVETKDYSWRYAENIAENMGIVFTSQKAAVEQKILSLDLAIRAAIYMNRFAAMDTCNSLIQNIQKDDTELGQAVAHLITKYRDQFVGDIDSSSCQNDYIRQTLLILKNN